MRRIFGAAIAVVFMVIGSTGTAHADQFDFISALDNSGVSYESISDMIDVGKELCHDLRTGATPPMVLAKLVKTGFAVAESAIILASAVDNMCFDAKPVVVNWARANGYTGEL